MNLLITTIKTNVIQFNCNARLVRTKRGMAALAIFTRIGIISHHYNRGAYVYFAFLYKHTSIVFNRIVVVSGKNLKYILTIKAALYFRRNSSAILLVSNSQGLRLLGLSKKLTSGHIRALILS